MGCCRMLGTAFGDFRLRLGFTLARALRNENFLAELSCVQEVMISNLANISVAIVGNSRALADLDNGTGIDAADIVIRINRAPMPSSKSHGLRTDWLALATSLQPNEAARISPKRILWMSPKRKRLPFWAATTQGFYLHPMADYQTLKELLGAPPSTGAMVIDLVAKSQATSIDLYGFDFFASMSLTGSRTAARVPHKFDAERGWVKVLVNRDHRVTLHS